MVVPRVARGVRYKLVHLLILLILAKMGGEDTLRGGEIGGLAEVAAKKSSNMSIIHYGPAHTAMACTFVAFRRRSAVRDVGKTLGLAPESRNKVTHALDFRKGPAGQVAALHEVLGHRGIAYRCASWLSYATKSKGCPVIWASIMGAWS